MSVKAPFRFAPISRRVHEPAWGRLATHDIPFSDGLSGQATITLTTITPLLVGGEPTPSTDRTPGNAYPLKIGDDYVIPDSTMQGLIRSILEISTFGRLGAFIDNRKFGIRDLSGSATAKTHYQPRLADTENVRGRIHVTPRTMAGFLQEGEDGALTITPCEMARIHVDDVLRLLNHKLDAKGKRRITGRNPFAQEAHADVRYGKFLDPLADPNNLADLNGRFTFDNPEWHDHQRQRFNRQTRQYEYNPKYIKIHYARCRPSATGTPGTLVLTGKQAARTGPGKKKWDFVFHDPDTTDRIVVDEAVWEAFAYLHEERPGSTENPNWGFWKSHFRSGGKVPVFYWLDEQGNLDTFGMAYAFKAAHTASTHDLLNNSSGAHTIPTDKAPLDLPHLIFGVAAEGDNGRGLKRRAWFGPGRTGFNGDPVNLGPAILLEPKPSYAGIYVRQEGQNGRVANRQPLATYSPVKPDGNGRQPPLHLKQPELAGVKIWPASHPQATNMTLDGPKGNLATAYKVQTRLHAIPHGQTFTIPLTFHNLRPVELGALLWALSYGNTAAFGSGDATLHHRLGMGKPFGLGEVALKLSLEIDTESPGKADTTPENLISTFETYMNDISNAWGCAWKETAQVKALLKAADPTQNNSGTLVYMPLGGQRDREDSYIGEKKRGGFLPPYVSGCEFSRQASPVPPAAPAAPQADLHLANGARIQFKGNCTEALRNKQGVIVELGANEYARHRIKLDNGRIVNERQSLFVVIAPPDETTPET